MNRALAVLTGAAWLVVVLEVAGTPRLVPSVLLGGVYALVAVVGFRVVSGRGRLAAVGFVVVQLVLGFAVFGAAEAGVGATLLLLVLVIQAVLLLPMWWAGVVAFVVPFAHVGMGFADGLRQMASTAVVVGFAFVLAALHLREQRARADLGVANQRLLAFAEQAEALATQAERTRVAREIHDGLGHHLTVVQMQVRAARCVLGQDATRADALLGKAEEQARAALVEVRRSVGALRERWEARPVVEAVAALAEDSTVAGLTVDVEVLGAARQLSPQTEQTLYRVTQEGLTNARKHAQARSARVVLDFTGPRVVRLSVEDDGTGPGAGSAPDGASDVGAGWDGGAGFGLAGIRERVEGLGGEVKVGRSTSGGLGITIELPG